MRIDMTDNEYRRIQGSIAELIATNRSLRNNCKRYERMLRAYSLKVKNLKNVLKEYGEQFEEHNKQFGEYNGELALKQSVIDSQAATIHNLRIRINELENTIEKMNENG